MLEELKREVYELHLELPKNRLVAWTSGNISGRDPSTGLVVIKPSGIRYAHLTPESMVVLKTDGTIVEGTFKPSADTATHLYVYRHRPNVMGIVHTHSPYATAFAAVGKPIPACLTSMADVFGGAVPIGDYCKIGGEEIGAEILRSIGGCPAIIMKNHGVFCVADTPEHALRAAIMVEEVAKTVSIALTLGDVIPLPAGELERQHQFYLTEYGQR